MISSGAGGPIPRRSDAALAGSSDHKSYGLARSRMRPRTFRPSTRTTWACVCVIRLLRPHRVADTTQLVGDDNVSAATITFPTVGVAVKDLSKTPSATNGSVSRLDPRGLEREASHLPHVAALRGLLIVRFTAIVGTRYQQTVGGQMFRVSKTADVSHLGQNRVGQDPGDTGNCP